MGAQPYVHDPLGITLQTHSPARQILKKWPFYILQDLFVFAFTSALVHLLLPPTGGYSPTTEIHMHWAESPGVPPSPCQVPLSTNDVSAG